MAFKDTLNSITIIVLFIILIISSILALGLENIKENWDKYRCNPMAMPLAGYLGQDTMDNFVFCISSIQKGMMSEFTDPLYSNINILSSVAGNISNNIGDAFKVIGKLDKFTFGMSLNILNVVSQARAEFEKVMEAVMDNVQKVLGVFVVLQRLIKSSTAGIASALKGPPGKIADVLCFKGDTPVRLNNGTRCEMKNVKIGDYLEGNIEVLGTLKLKGCPSNPFYKIWSKDLNENIYVTGKHRILSENAFFDSFINYIYVKNHPKSLLTNTYDEELYCLITKNHRIPIGEYVFWDWED